MEREQHTVVLEGATLTMGEELFEPSRMTQAIVGCCRDLYLQSLETFVFALIFSGKVGVYDGRTGIPSQKPTPLAKGLTRGFEYRLKEFGKRADRIVTVPNVLTDKPQEVVTHIETINRNYHSLNEWPQHFVREVWMYSLEEAEKKGIEQNETSLENALNSSEELELLLAPGYVASMLARVRGSIGRRTPNDEVVARFIRTNTVAHIAAHCAYHAALSVRDDLGENRSLMPHPTRQGLVTASAQSLMQFLVPSILYEIVGVRGVRKPEDLRENLGNYAADSSMIIIQRRIAQAFAASNDDDTKQLLNELTDATREVLMGFPIPGVRAGIRKLAMMRANYSKGRSGYDAGLEAIFPTLRELPPAAGD
jgi:hypothetical protein